MRQVDATFLEEKNKETNQPLRLFTVHDYDDLGTDLNFADAKESVIYDGTTYTSFSVRFERISENVRGEIDTVKIGMANVSRLIESYLQEYNWSEKKVSIITLFANELGDIDANIEDMFYIDSYSTTQNDVEFMLTSKLNVLGIEIPLGTYTRNSCQWIFKDVSCAYSGTETICDYTLNRCRELQNSERFGAFPSIPSKGIIIT